MRITRRATCRGVTLPSAGESLAVPTGGTPEEPAQLVEVVTSGEWAEVAPLVRATWPSLIQDHFATVRWLYEQLPAHVVDADPLLILGRALVQMGILAGGDAEGPLPSDPGALAALGRSAHGLHRTATATLRVILLRRAGLFQAACELSDRAEIVAGGAEASGDRRVAEWLPTLRLTWGITRQLGGRLSASVTDFERSYEGNLRLGAGALSRDAAGKAALSIALPGDPRRAALWLDREGALPPLTGWLAGTGPVAGLAARAIVGLDRLDDGAAASALEQLHPLSPREEYWPVVAYARARYGLLFGRPSDALDALAEVRSTHGVVGDGIARVLLLSAEMDLLLAVGDGDRVMRVMFEADDSYAQLGATAARLRLLMGHAEVAHRHTVEELRSTRSPRVTMELLLISAAARHQSGDEPGAREQLARAVVLAGRYGLLSPFAGVPRELLATFEPELPGLGPVIRELERVAAREAFGHTFGSLSVEYFLRHIESRTRRDVMPPPPG